MNVISKYDKMALEGDPVLVMCTECRRLLTEEHEAKLREATQRTKKANTAVVPDAV